MMEAVGIFKDGNELKIAHLVKKKGAIEIMNLEKICLEDNGNTHNEPVKSAEASDDIFGFNVDETGLEMGEGSSRSGYDFLLDKFAQYARADLRVGLNIPQEDVSVTKIVSSVNPGDKDIRKKLKEELEAVAGDINLDKFAFLPGNKTEFLLFYHNSTLSFMQDVLRVKRDLRSDFKISLLDINEISLVNLFRNTVGKDTRRSIVVFIGNEFSRILFFQDRNLVNVSQIINEGYHSSELLDNLYGKIVFEADAFGFEDFKNIYISGEGDFESYKRFFSAKFSECVVDRLRYEEHLIVNDALKDKTFNGFGIPVSIAWKILSGRNDNFIDTDFLPAQVKKLQSPLAISWHGAVLILGIVLSMAYLYFGARSINNRIDRAERQTAIVEEGIRDISEVASKADSMQRELSLLAPKIALIDSLRSKTVYFSELLNYTGLNIRNINSLWLKEFTASGSMFTVSGNSLFRNRIYQLANIFERARINIVDNGEIREKAVYPFNISGEIPKSVGKSAHEKN